MFSPGRLVLVALSFAAGLGVGLWYFQAPRPITPAPPPAAAPWNLALGSEPRFVDATNESGVAFRHENGLTGKFRYLEIMGGGVGVIDHDLDGDLDLFFVNGNAIEGPPRPGVTNHLYRNDGDLKFIDITAQAGVGGSAYGQGCAVGDYDRDGDPDLHVSNFGPNALYENRGGAFADVAASAGVADTGWGQTCAFFDHDQDGWLDLYVQNYITLPPGEPETAYIVVGNEKIPDYPSPVAFRGSPSRLFRNLGQRKFQDITEAAGLLRPDGKGMGLACLDLDGDDRVDLFVANDSMENFLFRGQSGGTYREDGLLAGVAYDGEGAPEASMGVDVGDYDGDGRFDLIVPCLRLQGFTLYRNLGQHFEDVAGPTGVAAATMPFTGFNANFLDYDLDGDLDLFFTNGGVRRNEGVPPTASYAERYGMTDLLLANDGQGKFSDASRTAGPYFAERRIGRGSVAADLDGDGDLDLAISNLADRAAILRNDTAHGHWLALDLRTRDGRRQPFGARVRVEAGGRVQHAIVHAGVTYLSQGDQRPRFGLGTATRADRVEITWPGGRRQELRDVAVDRVLEVVEE